MSITTYLRFTGRHVQRTMYLDIVERLQGLDWSTAGSVPFGASPFEYRTEPLDAEKRQEVTGNLVVVSFGDSPDDLDEELGGGLTQTDVAMFVDIIGTSEAVALSVAEDVTDYLRGRAPGTSRYRDLKEFASSPSGTVVDGWQLELTEVVRERPLSNAYRYWQVVKATINLHFPGDET